MYGENKVPTGDLICPEANCRAELIAVERKNGTRFLRNRSGTSDCGHAFGRPSGGGPPSPEHRWLQQRLAMLCGYLGYQAVPEHGPSHADVWVTSTPPLAIEIQRWPTAFADRSAARRSKGAKVLWLLPESASSPKVGQALFRHPAARIRVMHREDPTRQAKPWEPEHSGHVRVWIGATVMKLGDDGTLVSAGNYDALTFLREVLDGRRQWYGPNEPGFKFGSGWARTEDVTQMRHALLQRTRMTRTAALVTGAVKNSPPSQPRTPAPEPYPKPAAPQKPGFPSHASPPDGPIQEQPDRESLDATAIDSPTNDTHQEKSPTPSVTQPQPEPVWLQRLRAWLTGA